MRVGIFSDSLNIPPKEGINVHTYGVAKSLSCAPATEVLLIVCDRGWLNLDILQDQPFDTLVLSSAEFYDHEAIAKIINEYRLDVLQTYMVYFAAVVLGKASHDTKKPMVVEFHDLEKTVAPIYLSDESEIAFHDILQRRSGALASMVRVMSTFDYDYVNKTWPELADVTAWMPVCIKGPDIESGDQSRKADHVLFVGNTSYPPNEAAARFIEETLAPEMPEITFSLVGRGSERFKGTNVRAYGMVDNLGDLLGTHAVGLAPIFEGSGMKIKLLDYLSAGMPVLTTPLGSYGYPESEAIIVEGDTAKWPSILRDLLKDEDKLQNRSAAARELFKQHFDIENSLTSLIETYKALRYAPISTPQDFPDLPVDQSKIYWLKEIRETPRQPVTERQLFKGRGAC